MAATADPSNAVDPLKPRPRRNYPAGYTSPVAPAPLPVPPPALPAPVDGAYTGRGSPDFVARRSVYTPGPGEASAPLAPPPPPPTVVDGRVSAPPAPPVSVVDAQYESAPVRTEAQAREYNNAQALEAQAAEAKNYPQGVTKRGDGFFTGVGAKGEPVYSDTAYAPQFAGVANASADARAGFDSKYLESRDYANGGKSNISTDADIYQKAREAEIKAAGEDYKKYVAAGSPRTVDGRGLSEYDFIQRRQRNSLENFLDSDGGGGRDGGDALNRRGAGGNPLSNAKTAQDIALDAAKGTIDVEKGSLDVEDRLRKRGDDAIAAGAKKYEENPTAALRKYGPGISPAEAAALDYAQTAIDAEGEDFLATPAGRAARAAAGKIAAREYNNRKYFESKRGLLTTKGLAQADPAQFSFKRNDDVFAPDDFTIEGPTFDRTDKEGKRMVAEDDPNAERYPAQVGRRGLSGGRDAPEFISEQGLGSFISKIKIADKRKAERDKKK